jgi:hypothetical protein
MSDILYKKAKEFNSILLFFVRLYVKKKKGSFDEDKAHRAQKRIGFLVQHEPYFLIETAGPFILKYAKMIKEEDWKSFMKLDFTEEMDAYKQTNDGKGHTNKMINTKINFIKKVWVASNDKEQKHMGDKIKELLKLYCEFAIAIKNGAKI